MARLALVEVPPAPDKLLISELGTMLFSLPLISLHQVFSPSSKDGVTLVKDPLVRIRVRSIGTMFIERFQISSHDYHGDNPV